MRTLPRAWGVAFQCLQTFPFNLDRRTRNASRTTSMAKPHILIVPPGLQDGALCCVEHCLHTSRSGRDGTRQLALASQAVRSPRKICKGNHGRQGTWCFVVGAALLHPKPAATLCFPGFTQLHYALSNCHTHSSSPRLLQAGIRSSRSGAPKVAVEAQIWNYS